MINFKCPKCGEEMSVPESLAGQQEACPSCGNTTIVPQPDPVTPVQTPPPAAPPTYQPAPQIVLPTNLNVKVKGIKSTNGLGVAALILGILAALTCWIPFVGMIGMPLAILGLVFGIIGFLIALIGRKSGVGMPVSGCIVCVIALIVAIATTGGTVGAISKSADEASKTEQEVVNPTESESSARSPETSWALATSAVRQGDVQVRIVSANIGKVQVEDSFGEGSSPSKDDLFSIAIEITNLSQTQKLHYRTWAGADFTLSRDFGTLTDNFGNSYKRITFGMGKPVGRITSDSVYPGKAIRDILIFEVPIERVKYLRLELPAKSFGGNAMIRFRIPASMIDRKTN